MASSSLMASQTVALREPIFLSPLSNHATLTPRKPFPFLDFSNPKKSLNLSVSDIKPITRNPRKCSMLVLSSTIPTNPSTNSPNAKTPTHSLTGSTRTITTLLAITLSASKLLAEKIGSFDLKLKGFFTSPNPDELLSIQGIQDTLVCTVGPLFFAALKTTRPSGALNTPLTVVAAGMAKWLDIYSGVLMVRVLLSWFPNIPWEKQPLCAIRDLCDPYLNLFRNIIPPIFDTLDVSPLLAFAVLGTFASVLNTTSRAY